MTATAPRPRLLVSLLLTLTMVLAACGEDTQVGTDVDLNIRDQAQERLGETTTTIPVASASPGEDRVGVGQTTTVPTPPPTAPPVTETPAEQAALEITINADTADTTQFDPSAARVFAGSLVRWVNRDAVARSVAADDRTFESGPIPPGGEFVWRADAVGEFNYTDGTRPYAVATIEVVPR